MSDKITKLQRWLDLIAYLLGRRYPVTVERVMEGVPAYAEKWKTEEAKARETVRRQFERDKDELRKFGIPIDTIEMDVEGERTKAYSLTRRDFYLPYLKLLADALPEEPRRGDPAAIPTVEIAHEDARAAMDALRRVAQVPSFPFEREARSAFRKLAFDIDPAHYADEAPVLYAEPPGAAEIADKVKTLSEALLARKRVRFRYHGIYRGEATDRDVAPYGLAFTRGHWYLVGHDRLRDALRVFRVGRMETPRVNSRKPNTSDYEVPADFRLEEHVGKDPWELGDGGDGGDAEDDALRAEVLFEFPSSLWAARNRKGELVEERADGSAVRAFDGIQQVDPFLRWVLSFVGEAKILSPPELAKELREMACAVAALHEGPPRETWGGAEGEGG